MTMGEISTKLAIIAGFYVYAAIGCWSSLTAVLLTVLFLFLSFRRDIHLRQTGEGRPFPAYGTVVLLSIALAFSVWLVTVWIKPENIDPGTGAKTGVLKMAPLAVAATAFFGATTLKGIFLLSEGLAEVLSPIFDGLFGAIFGGRGRR